MSARAEAKVTVSEIKEEVPWTDFTPAIYRQTARRVSAASGLVHVELSESERDDPSIVFLSLRVGASKRFPNEVIADGADIPVQQLDTLIELLTVARDTAIVEGMIEPAVEAC